MPLSLLARRRIPRPVIAVAAAALPAAAIYAALTTSAATGPRYFPLEPKAPSPFIVAGVDANVAGSCQIGAVVVDGDEAKSDVGLRLARVLNEGDGAAEEWLAVSDKHGVHRFIDLPAGDYQLTALAADRAPAAADFHCDGEANRAFFTLSLVQAQHVFSGRVVSKNGRPAAGAEVALRQESDSKSALSGTARIPVGDDGSFSVRVAPGRYIMTTTAANHAPTVRKVTFDDASPASVMKLALTPAPHVNGRVLDEEGKPIEGALVALGGVLDPKQPHPTVTTDRDGTYSLPVIDGQNVTVTVHAKNGLVARADVGVVEGVLGRSNVDMVAAAGRSVSGVVTRPDGSVWAFGDVVYRVRDLGLEGKARADADGRFVVDGMPADADVEVWADGNASGAWGAQVASPGNDVLALVYTPPAY